jgi:hypothetical protein
LERARRFSLAKIRREDDRSTSIWLSTTQRAEIVFAAVNSTMWDCKKAVQGGKPKCKKLELMSESASTPAVIQVADALPSGGQK